MDKERHSSHVEIKSDKENPVVIHIFIDGHEIKGVRSFKMEYKEGYPVLTLDLNAFNVSVDSPMVTRSPHFSGDMEIKFKETITS